MDFSYTEEQQLLADSLARFLRDQYDFDTRRRIVASPHGYSREHWQKFAELGWLAVPLPEADGGLGGSMVDTAVLFEQFGRALVVEPFLATLILGGGLVCALADASQREDLVPRLAGGELQLAVAFAEPESRYELDCVSTRAEHRTGGWRLSGHKAVVLNAPVAELVLVSAVTEAGGLSVFSVDPRLPGVSASPFRLIDGTRAAELRFADVELPGDALLGAEGAALPALSTVIDRATLCVCAEAIGAMDTLLWKTVEYTRTRKQFGVSLSSFQALQHRMAEMFIELEQSRSILMMAVMAMDGGENVARAVSAAKARIGRAARLVGQEAIQLHGGIGVTDELDVSHYFKRLTAIEALFGNSDWHLRRFGASAGES